MTYDGVSKPWGAFRTQTAYGPRIALAWQPWGTQSKTVVRAGWGMFPGNSTGVGTWTNFGGCSCSSDGNWISPDNGITAPFYLKNGFPNLARGQINPATGQQQIGGAGFGAVPLGKSPNYSVSYADYYDYKMWYADQYNLPFSTNSPLT
jgi:hypothetical protein